MSYRNSQGYKLFRLFNIALMAVTMTAIAFPFLHLLALSFSDSAAVVGGRVTLWPIGWDAGAYARVFSHPSVASGFANALAQTVIGTVVGVLMLTICAYPLSKQIKGRRLIMRLIMATMFFSGGLIPTYTVVKGLGMIDTIWAIVIPFCIMPYYLMIMISFFRSFPEGLEESAMIDGLGPIMILLRIVLPLSRAVIATMGLFLAVYYWNNWFNALIYLNSTNKYPIMLIARHIVAGADLASDQSYGATGRDSLSGASLKAAVIMVTMLPIAALIPFAQRHFNQGVMLGAVKG